MKWVGTPESPRMHHCSAGSSPRRHSRAAQVVLRVPKHAGSELAEMSRPSIELTGTNWRRKVGQARLGEHVIKGRGNVSLPVLEIKPDAIET